MRDSLSNAFLARLISAFFVMAGVLACVRGLVSTDPEIQRALLVPAALAAAGVGVVAWFLPWDRWPRVSLLSLALLAFGIKGLTNLAGGTGPYIFVVHYVVLFMWIGVAGPRGGSLGCLPPFAVSYLLPMWIQGRPLVELASFATVAPACLALGELAGWLTDRLRSAERASRERAEKMATLVDATHSLAACRQVEELGRLTARGAVQLHAAHSALVLLPDGDAGLRRVGDLDWKLGGSGVPRALAEALARDLEGPSRTTDSALFAELGAALDVPGIRALPLQGSGSPLGVALVAQDEPVEVLDDFDEYVVRTFATQAGLGFERLEAADRLRDASLHDPLTALGNRRKASARLEVLKAGDVLVIVDLDHFKRVNDSFGHAAGDQVLRTLADYLRSCVRPPDEVFRLGGEEFLIVLAEGGAGGGAAMRRILDGWRGQHRVTSWSAGVAVHDEAENAERTLARADAALYAAKRAGRDRVMDWHPELASGDLGKEPEGC